MSSIKLKHSGGNSVIIAAPSSNPASDRTLTLPSNADGTMLTTTNPKAGNIIQVLQAVKTDTFSTSSAGFSTITGLEISITPSSSSNKILIHYDANVSGDDLSMVRLVRGSTAIAIGDASSSRQRITQGGQFQGGNNDKVAVYSGSFLDSPSSTSSLTYKLQVYRHGGTIRVNTTFNDADASYTGRGISTITVMEVAG